MMRQLVEPIRDRNAIERVEKYLYNRNLRNRLIFVFGINSGLRVSDILKLDVIDVKNKTHVEILEQKTGKYKKFLINSKLQKIINDFVKDAQNEAPLFVSQKGFRLERSQVYRMLNDACRNVGIDVNIGTHTMRKTFGYHHYKQFKDVAMLQKIFNHSSPSITLRYIGIEQDEIDNSYSNFEL